MTDIAQIEQFIATKLVDNARGEVTAARLRQAMLMLVDYVAGNTETVAWRTQDFTLRATDMGKTLLIASDAAITLTVPNTAIPVGASVELGQMSSGAVTIAAGDGVVVDTAQGYVFDRRYLFGRLTKTGANRWSLAVFGAPSGDRILAVVDRGRDEPPGAEVPAGARYIVGPAPTGPWEGKAGQLAEKASTGGWDFAPPVEGFRVFVIAEGVDYAWTAANGWRAVQARALAAATLAALIADYADAPIFTRAEIGADTIAKTATRARAANVATVKTQSAHGLIVGAWFNSSALGGDGYNGRFAVVSVPDATTLTYASVGAAEAETPDAGGNLNRNGVYSANGAGVWDWLSDLYGASPIAAGARVLLLRGDESLAPDGRVRWGGVVADRTRSLDGRLVDGLTILGEREHRHGPLAIGMLRDQLFPDPRDIFGVATVLKTFARTDTTRGFFANLETAGDYGGAMTGNAFGVAYRLSAYVQRTDIPTQTVYREAPLVFTHSTGTSVSIGLNGSTQFGEVLHESAPGVFALPAVCKYSCFSWPPDASEGFGSGARGAGSNDLSSILPSFKLDEVDFVPLSEKRQTGAGAQGGETSWASYGALLQYYAGLAHPAELSEENLVLRASGAAGKELMEVMDGTTPWSNQRLEMEGLKTISRALGLAVEIPHYDLDDFGHERWYSTITLTATTASGASIAYSGDDPRRGQIVTGHANLPANVYIQTNPSVGQLTLSANVTGAIPSGTVLVCAPNVGRIGSLLDELRADYIAQMGDILDQDLSSLRLRIVLSSAPSQAAAPTETQSHGPTIAQAVLDHVRANPDKAIIPCPAYVAAFALEASGNVNQYHFSKWGYGLIGELKAKSRLYERLTGQRWSAYGEHVTVTRVGATLKIRVWRDAAHTIPWGGANFDATYYAAFGTCSPLANHGFRAMSDGGANICTGVAISNELVAGDGYDLALSSAQSVTGDYAWIGSGSTLHAATWGVAMDGGDQHVLAGVSRTITSLIVPGLVLKNPFLQQKFPRV